MPEAITLTFRPHYDKNGKRIEEKGELDTSKYQYVSIPERDIFDKPFRGLEINGQKLLRGETYFLPPDFAAEARRLLDVAQKADMRLMQSTPDLKSVDQLSGDPSSAGRQAGSTFIRG